MARIKNLPKPHGLRLYIIDDDRNIVEIEDIDEWLERLPTIDVQIALDVIGRSQVSTVFLTTTPNLFSNKPKLFETMVFGGPLDSMQWRYFELEEALAGHAAIVAKVRGAEQVIEAIANATGARR